MRLSTADHTGRGAARAMLSRTERSGRRLPFWKTMPISFLRVHAPLLDEAGRPLTMTSPASGVHSKPAIRSNDDLPEPDAPRSHTISPGNSSRLTSRNTVVRRPRATYDFVTDRRASVDVTWGRDLLTTGIPGS